MNDSPGRARANSGGDQAGGWGPGGPGNTGRPGGTDGSGGYGPGGGWGRHPWPPAAPPAPRPGVIPLRPLTVGEIVQGALGTMQRYWRTVFGVTLAVSLCTQAVGTVVQGVWMRNLKGLERFGGNGDEVPSGRELLDALKNTAAGISVGMLVSIVGSIIATGVITTVVSHAVLGRPSSLRDAWTSARPRLLSLAGLFCVLPLLGMAPVAAASALGLAVSAANVAIGAALLVAGMPVALAVAAWIWIRYSLAAPALMLERQGVVASMRRSAKLVKGSWWRIFGIQLLAALLVFVVAAVIQVPANMIEMILNGGRDLEAPLTWSSLIIDGIGATIGSTIALPLTAGVTALLYIDQRIRRESLDLELARAASE
ncbi:hypothetical protein GCM10010218_63480 [Streptomyces mashuensis]|uniref:Glycerophosphoryl diester phosphodiesterase membrane domain-containing protein n=1 Tax=Streptomyces mashuensis TaxID=33904 RepID=A0A919BAR3_9ACTN|nr:glycerophosphoryl diester phosphodiesterase membrane domain-containing protein [Streptomyces mashuensis]GHF73566.1 hypothetical protein GCM10010218_63480 [Streptomyces mashuensis]